MLLDSEDYELLGWGESEKPTDAFFDKYQETKARTRVNAYATFLKNKDDPEYKAKEAARQRELYAKQMQDPVLKQREVERSRAKYLKRKRAQQ